MKVNVYSYQGITETVEHLHRNYFWPKIERHVTNYINFLSCSQTVNMLEESRLHL